MRRVPFLFLTVNVIAASLYAQPSVSNASGPTIDVWYGPRQRVGHFGRVQDDFNLLGHVSDPDGIASLTYRLNGAPPVALSVGSRADGFGDGRRLAATGDFNADIPLDSLNLGRNTIALTATDNLGHRTTKTVAVTRATGTSSLPVSIDWTQAEDPQDVGLYVDGKWEKKPGGLQITRPGYDRIYLMGNVTWRDYEITVPVRIHAVDDKTGPRSGWPGLGLLLRFTGHHADVADYNAQPKYGHRPYGAITWLRWTGGPARPPVAEFLRGDEPIREGYGQAPVSRDQTYLMKARCETLPDARTGEGVTRYRWKLWPADADEPADWQIDYVQESSVALRQGSVGLIAHHVTATFGDVTILPAAPTQDGNVIPETFPLSATLRGTLARLEWSAPDSSASFEVQHASEEDFETLHKITAVEDTYTYYVQDLLPGQHAFRIKQNRIDGRVRYSKVQELVLEAPAGYSLSEAFPNPFNPSTRFTLSVDATQHVQVAVYDLLGRRLLLIYDDVLEADQRKEFVLDAAGFSNGTYLVTTTGEAFRTTTKLVLLR